MSANDSIVLPRAGLLPVGLGKDQALDIPFPGDGPLEVTRHRTVSGPFFVFCEQRPTWVMVGLGPARPPPAEALARGH